MPHHNQRKWQENGERKANIVCRNEQVVYLDEVFYYLMFSVGCGGTNQNLGYSFLKKSAA